MTGTNQFGNMPPHPPHRKDPPTHEPFRVALLLVGQLTKDGHWQQPEAGFLVTYWNVGDNLRDLQGCVATWEELP